MQKAGLMLENVCVTALSQCDFSVCFKEQLFIPWVLVIL